MTLQTTLQMTLQKPPLFATLLTVLAMLILCALGTWQIQRLSWKQDILRHMDAQTSTEPYISAAELQDNALTDNQYLYQRGHIKARFLGTYCLLIPRTHDGHAGKDILAPVITENNHFLLVNLGWLPFKTDFTDILPPDHMTLYGFVRRPDKKGLFTPDNDHENRLWYAVDFNNLGDDFLPPPPETLPVMFYNEAALPFAPSLIPHDAGWRPNNNHLSYALFWYMMACTLLVIFCLRFVIIKTPPSR